jgi:hypothetical protein
VTDVPTGTLPLHDAEVSGSGVSAHLPTPVDAAGGGLYFDEICRLYAEHFGKHWPTSNLIGVADLARPLQLVEIAELAVPEPNGSR